MKKKYYSWQDVECAADSIVSQLAQDQWCPEVIVGINRGGLPLAMLLSHKLNTRMYTLDIRLRDGEDNDCESNLWLAEWAFGYNYPAESGIENSRWDLVLRKKILIVDDINDSGKTFLEVVSQNVFNKGYVTAALYSKTSSDFTVDIHANLADDDVWYTFPWERHEH